MKKLVLLSLTIFAVLLSCNKEDSKDPIQSQTFEINSTNSTEWKYFSFSKSDTINVADPFNSNDWDLAFQRYRIRTNGGKSGNGNGSAANSFLKGQAGFDELTIVPDTLTFVEDDSISIAVMQGYSIYLVNPVLYNWFSMEFASQGTQIVPSDNIYVVKTATGDYAKVWFKTYYSSENKSGYVTIQYKYQPDGSKNLE